jgi:hypothetical protein
MSTAISSTACCAISKKRTLLRRARPVAMAADAAWNSPPYQRRMTDGRMATVYYCGDCRARAMVEFVDDYDVERR